MQKLTCTKANTYIRAGFKHAILYTQRVWTDHNFTASIIRTGHSTINIIKAKTPIVKYAAFHHIIPTTFSLCTDEPTCPALSEPCDSEQSVGDAHPRN